MTGNDLTNLLHDAVGEPPRALVADTVLRRARQRHYARTSAVGSAAALAVAAVVVVPSLLGGGSATGPGTQALRPTPGFGVNQSQSPPPTSTGRVGTVQSVDIGYHRTGDDTLVDARQLTGDKAQHLADMIGALSPDDRGMHFCPMIGQWQPRLMFTRGDGTTLTVDGFVCGSVTLMSEGTATTPALRLTQDVQQAVEAELPPRPSSTPAP